MTSAFPLQWPEGWPRTKGYERKFGKFATTYEKTMGRLEGEIRRMKATGLVISSNLPLRQDGRPRADVARRSIGDPGVAIYFTRGKKTMVMARDVYENVYDNLHSLTLAIEHLRGLERHGGSTMMDRAFEGFAQLPDYSNAPPKDPWWRVLGFDEDPAGVPTSFRRGILLQAEASYRERAKRAHPDAGGTDLAMAELSEAIEQARRDFA